MKIIKLSNFEISNIVEILMDSQSIINTSDPEKKLPIEVLWKIDENLEKLMNINSRIKKKRNEIEQEYINDECSYIDTLESGEQIRRIKKEYFKEFNEKIMELMQIQNEIEINPVEIKTLKNYLLVPKDFRSIRFMLDNSNENTVIE